MIKRFVSDEFNQVLKNVLSNGVVTVTFEKSSTSTVREMVCSLNSKFLPPKKPLTSKGSVVRKTPNTDLCTVYDLERDDWRSFRFDSVKKFKTGDGTWEPKRVFVTDVEFTPAED